MNQWIILFLHQNNFIAEEFSSLYLGSFLLNLWEYFLQKNFMCEIPRRMENWRQEYENGHEWDTVHSGMCCEWARRREIIKVMVCCLTDWRRYFLLFRFSIVLFFSFLVPLLIFFVSVFDSFYGLLPPMKKRGLFVLSHQIFNVYFILESSHIYSEI